MTKIVFFCSKEDISNKFLYEIKKLINIGLSEIKSRIENGRPFAEFMLYENDHYECEENIMTIINLTEQYQIKYNIYKIINDVERISSEDSIKEFKTNKERLYNLFKSRKESIAYYEELDALREDD